MKREGSQLHLGVAEQGKLHALAGEHRLALLYYREAMRMCMADKAPEVLFRHYLECSIESLELTESYPEVVDYCDRALALYAETPPPNEIARRDLAAIHERRGLVLAKMGRKEAAREALEKAKGEAGQIGVKLPIADTVSRWIASGLHIQPARVTAEQKRHGFFLIREDTVEPGRAIRLPDEHLATLR